MTPDELLNKIYSENNPWVGQVEDKVLEALVSDAKLTKIQAKPIEHKQPVASGLPVDPKDCELLVAFEANGSCYLTPDASCPFPTQNNGTVLLAECMEARAYEYEQQSDLDYLLIEAQETEPVIGVHKDKPVENVEFMDQMLVQQQEKDADLDYLLVRPVERQMPTRQECENLTADAYAKIGREKEDTMVSSLTMSQPEQRLQNLYEHINPSGAVSGQDLLNALVAEAKHARKTPRKPSEPLVSQTAIKYQHILSHEERQMLSQVYQRLAQGADPQQPLDALLNHELARFRNKRFTSKL